MQRPLLTPLPTLEPTHEDAACAQAAEALYDVAVTMPADSEKRALMLRSSARWAAASHGACAPRLHRAQTG
jgi:hypothetical protein